MASLGDTWRDYTRNRRLWFIAAFIWGFGILLLDVVLDLAGIWGSLTVLPGMLNTLGGFLIGVPVALVLFSTLTAEREDKSHQDKISALSDRAWATFSRQVEAFCIDARIDALRLAADQISSRWQEICNEMKAYVTEPASTPRYENLVKKLGDWSVEFDSLITRVNDAIPNMATIQLEWSGVISGWGLLNSFVKIRRFELRLSWLSDDIDARLRQQLGSSRVIRFLSWHEFNPESPDSPKMSDIPQYLAECAKVESAGGLQAAFKDFKSPVNRFPIQMYSACARSAATSLEQLRRQVSDAERGDRWPAPPKAHVH